MSSKITEIKEFRRLVRDGIKYDPMNGCCYDGKRIYGFINNKTGRWIALSPYQPKKSDYSREYTRYIQLDRFIYWLHFGVIPEVIRHMNDVKDDCRIENLRELKRINGEIVINELPSQEEIEIHRAEIIKLEAQYDYKSRDWYKDWKQKLIEKGEWCDKETYYNKRFSAT